MSILRTTCCPRTGLLGVLVLTLLGLSLLVGCGSSGTGGGTTGAKLLHYQRVWQDGRV